MCHLSAAEHDKDSDFTSGFDKLANMFGLKLKIMFINFRAEAHLFKLERNYRSTRNIVEAANSIIAKNRDQISKKIWSKKETGEKIKLIRAATDNEEGYLIANLIKDAVYAHQLHHQEIAILYRTNAQSRIFEEALRKLNIPYKVYGSLSFYQRKEIKDLLGYFRLTVNPFDEESLRRIINYPARGIGQTTVTRLEDIATSQDKRIWDVLLSIDDHSGIFNQGTIRKLKAFFALINGYRDNLQTMEAFDLAYSIAESSGIMKDLHYQNSPENLSKWENLQEILNGIKEFVESQEEAEDTTLESFLQSVSLLTDADSEKEKDRDKVTIMTAHAAKGLEYRFVYVTGLEEELFPSRMSSNTREEIEEERRLFYVAVTRAMEQVTLSYATTRYRWGVPVNAVPSRFIREIEPEYIDTPLEEKQAEPLQPSWKPSQTAWKPSQKKVERVPVTTEKIKRMTPVSRATPASGSGTSFTADDPAEIQTGMKVEHLRFGFGKIINLEGELPNRKATVFFKEHGQKQLLLKFAKLKIIP